MVHSFCEYINPANCQVYALLYYDWERMVILGKNKWINKVSSRSTHWDKINNKFLRTLRPFFEVHSWQSKKIQSKSFFFKLFWDTSQKRAYMVFQVNSKFDRQRWQKRQWRVIEQNRRFDNFRDDRNIVCLYLPIPPLGQDMTQGQFLSGV